MHISIRLEIQYFVVVVFVFRICFIVLCHRQNERNPRCVFDAGS